MEESWSKASRASLKILRERGIGERSACLVNMLPETPEAKQAFLEWLQGNKERNLSALILEAIKIADQYPPKDEKKTLRSPDANTTR